MDIASYTCPGGRNVNEDSFFAGEDVFVVADGLGGHEKGEDASSCAIKSIRENSHGYYSDGRILEILNVANKAVRDLDNQGRTTVAAAFLESGIFRYANVGDSRVYYFRNGKVFAQSKDHSVCQAAVDMGFLKPEEIRMNEDRPRLLKALGGREELDIKECYPHIEMQAGDAFLLCSDGFWEYVYEEEMETELQNAANAEDWLAAMLRHQLTRANNQGDNYTAICVKVDETMAFYSKQKHKENSFWKLFRKYFVGARTITEE